MKFVKSNLDPVEIEINGTKYLARLPFAALAELEELTGESFIQLFDKIDSGRMTVDELMKMLYVALKGGGVDITLPDLQENDFSLAAVHEMMNKIGQLLTRTMNVEPVTESSDSKKKTVKPHLTGSVT